MSALLVDEQLAKRDPAAFVSVRRADGADLGDVAQAAQAVLRRVLDEHGFTQVPAEVTAERRGRHLRVRLVAGAPVPRPVLSMAAVRSIGSVRAIDPIVASIGVGATAPAA